MTASRLHRIALHGAIFLMLSGLIVSVYVGAHGIGMVVAMAGLVAYGAAGMALYLAWEGGDA